FAIHLTPARARRRPVQHVTVDALDAQVLQRARIRLFHLPPDRRLRVIGKPRILPGAKSELGLNEELSTSDARTAHCRPDARFEIMFALIRGVDAAKARLEREQGQRLGLVLLPRRAVNHCYRHPAMMP